MGENLFSVSFEIFIQKGFGRECMSLGTLEWVRNLDSVLEKLEAVEALFAIVLIKGVGILGDEWRAGNLNVGFFGLLNLRGDII